MYNDQVKQTSCKNCLVNTFADQTSRNSCQDCGVGEKSELGSAKCLKCDAGESGTGVGGTCEVCAKGQYRTSAMNADSCKTCPFGFAQESTGQASVSSIQYSYSFCIIISIGVDIYWTSTHFSSSSSSFLTHIF